MRVVPGLLALGGAATPMLADAESYGLLTGLGNLGGMGLLALALFFLMREQNKGNREDRAKDREELAKEREQRDRHHDAVIFKAEKTRHLVRNFWQAMHDRGACSKPLPPERPQDVEKP